MDNLEHPIMLIVQFNQLWIGKSVTIVCSFDINILLLMDQVNEKSASIAPFINELAQPEVTKSSPLVVWDRHRPVLNSAKFHRNAKILWKSANSVAQLKNSVACQKLWSLFQDQNQNSPSNFYWFWLRIKVIESKQHLTANLKAIDNQNYKFTTQRFPVIHKKLAPSRCKGVISKVQYKICKSLQTFEAEKKMPYYKYLEKLQTTSNAN